ncbi:MAG: hypothetical protein QOF48_984 [Verrucomicrobiota bacterium]
MNPELADLDRFFELTVDLLCIAGFDGTLHRVNPAWEHTLGFDARTLPGKSLADFVHPDDWETAAGRLARLQSCTRPAVFEWRCRTRAGEWRWLEWNIASEPARHVFHATARDINDRKRAESEIQKLAAFPRMNPGAVFEFGEDGRLTYFNDAAMELARSLGMPHPSKILPLQTSTIISECLAQNRGVSGLESSLLERTLSWSFHPVMASHVVHGYAADITARKKSEERIREQAELLDKAHDAIVVRDLEHRILYWNKGAERLFGWTAAEAVGRNAIELLKPDETCLAAIRRVMETGSWTGELTHASKAGPEVLVESRWTLVPDAEGRPKAILVMATDITAKKSLETQFLRAQRLESIGSLASGIAHDLNNVLAPIMMSVNLLQESLTDEHDRRLLEMLRLSVLRGADMTRQILTFTRGRNGERGVVNLKHLVAEIAKIAQSTFPRLIRLESDCAKDLWTVVADATQMHQVLMNLCVNARDAMPDGGLLSIALRNVVLEEKHSPLQPEAKPGRYVRLTVTDTGIGIAPENLERIWDPFFSSKPDDQGTGLGLSTVARIVRSHAGFAHVESRPGHGACFEIYLPAASADAAGPLFEVTAPIGNGHGETILIVDDERVFQEITAAIFTKYGYRVLTASDGIEALAVFSQQKDRIDLVVTDMVMPCLDGPATIRGLQRLKPGLRVIATSGLGENEAIARSLGGTFLLKPFTSEKLLHAVSESLRQPESDQSI